MALELEHDCLDLRYAGLRTTSRAKERLLFASLAENGQLLPVIVVPDVMAGRYVLIDGYKRARALNGLQIDVVQALCWDLKEPDALICERLLRRSASDGPLEQGWLLQELKQRFKLSQAELARRFDVSESWVSRRLALAGALPEVIHEAVRSGRIVAHAAQKYLVPLARANREHSERLCRTISPLNLSSRQVGVLYAAYQQADTDQRDFIVTQPEVILRAHNEIKIRPAVVDSIEQLKQAARELAAIVQRLLCLLQTERATRLRETAGGCLKPYLEQIYFDAKALVSASKKEIDNAGYQPTDSDPGVT